VTTRPDNCAGEDDLLPLSGLSQVAFCPRRAALIHVEGQWEENRFTIEGRHMHERVHELGDEARGEIRIVRGLALRSLRLGLVGVADVVEFHAVPSDDPTSAGQGPAGVRLPGVRGLWRPYPVEYKRGRRKPDNSDSVQLCAQAMCLEEMLGVPVPEGALYYGRTRKRLVVALDASLRRETEEAARTLHAIVRSGRTPQPVLEKKCRRCSLFDLCEPKAAGRSARRYLDRMISEATRRDPEVPP